MLVGVLVHWVALAQGPVDHWEAVAQDGTSWSYLIPQSQPLPYWMFGNFAETGWSEGVSGFGYGDGDDATEISPAHSIYLRHTFNLDDLSAFVDARFAMDYDDGYVAYLNGTEIGRGNAGAPGEVLAWDAVLDGWHEAVLYAEAPPTSLNLTQLCSCRVQMCWRWKFTTTTSRPRISRHVRFCFWVPPHPMWFWHTSCMVSRAGGRRA